MRSLLAGVVLGLLAAAPEASAAPWCGTIVDGDRAPIVAGHPIRLLYATPADGADNSAVVAQRIVDDVAEIESWWLREDSSRKPRFDQAAFSCGVQPDIGRLVVPGRGADLADPDLAWDTIRATLASWPLATLTKFLVYYDGPSKPGRCGTGGGAPSGFGVAVVSLAGCPGLGTAATAAHELLHTLGAVPRIGPASNCPSSPGHVCDSSGDLMYPFAQPSPMSSFQLDVGRNDYYGHSGSWLDTQDSPWLQRLDAAVRLELRLQGTGSVESDVPGVACSSSCTTSWNPGTQVLLRALPAPNQVFAGWRGACEGDSFCRVSLESTTALTAVFAPDHFRLAVKVDGRGRVTSAPSGIACPGRCAAQLFSFGTTLLRAKPAKGWRFLAWSGACRGRKLSCEFELAGNVTARATFVRARTR